MGGVSCREEIGEDASRIVVSCIQENVARIKQAAEKHGILMNVVGETLIDQIEIKVDGQTVISGLVSEFNQSYEGSLERALKADPELVAAD